MICGWALISSNALSAGGQDEQLCEVNNSTTTGVFEALTGISPNEAWRLRPKKTAKAKTRKNKNVFLIMLFNSPVSLERLQSKIKKTLVRSGLLGHNGKIF